MSKQRTRESGLSWLDTQTPLLSAAVTIALAIVYIGASGLGLSMAFVHTSVSPVWPPTGIAIAALLMLGTKAWPGVSAGAFVANLSTGVSALTAAGIACGNTLEALLAAFLVRRYIGVANPLERAKDVLAFVVLAGALSTLVSATIGTTTLCATGAAPWDRYGSLWLTWWLGDASGAVVVAPVLLAMTTSPFDSGAPRPLRLLEGGLLLALQCVVALVIFTGSTPAGTGRYPLEFLTVPLLLWAALRFGQSGVGAATAVLSSVAIWGTLHGFGPFDRDDPNDSLMLLQGFICTSAITFFVLAALIAERRRSDADNARLYEESQKAGRIKDEFLATVSHELRTPLHAIFGWVRILQLAPLDEANHAKALETIERNARAQARLVDDLLDVSRIVAGTLALETEPIRVGPIVQAAIDSAGPQAGARTISIDASVGEPNDLVLGDPNRLLQVVGNLLSNAIKFTPAGGCVIVRLARLEAGVTIEVSDNGNGIDAEFLPFVFDRFRQADGSTTRRHGGLGLGLAIVRHLVELHGGTVEAASPGPGRGATFTVVLPPAASGAEGAILAEA